VVRGLCDGRGNMEIVPNWKYRIVQIHPPPTPHMDPGCCIGLSESHPATFVFKSTFLQLPDGELSWLSLLGLWGHHGPLGRSLGDEHGTISILYLPASPVGQYWLCVGVPLTFVVQHISGPPSLRAADGDTSTWPSVQPGHLSAMGSSRVVPVGPVTFAHFLHMSGSASKQEADTAAKSWDHGSGHFPQVSGLVWAPETLLMVILLVMGDPMPGHPCAEVRRPYTHSSDTPRRMPAIAIA